MKEELKDLTIIFLSHLTYSFAVGAAIFTALGIGACLLKLYLKGAG